MRLSSGAQHLRAASFEGLVSLDPAGQIVPAIAERWIVTDDGLSYIFRLRNTSWPDGEPITADDVRLLLRDTLNRLEGSSLGLDLAKVTEVRAMTGRVVELRLSSPMPEFLRLLAQPELGFVKSGGGAGPMIASRDEDAPIARLSALPPEARGFAAREDWEELARGITVRALPAADAVDAFADGEVDLLLNGRLSSFPLAQLGPLSRGAIQVDPAIGVFGLVIRSDAGILTDAARREALSMALDRDALIQPFGLGGWQSATWIVPPGQFGVRAYPDSRWEGLSIEERRAIAQRRILAWTPGEGESAELRIGLPEGPGSDLLFQQLQESWGTIGITLQRVAPGEGADLELRDRVARYSSPRWFLNQFNCELEIGLCSPEADELVLQSLTVRNFAAKQRLLAEAHAALVEEEVFIPLGAPVRWSLVRGAITAYQANQWGLHPLFPLSQPTT
ncbi:peptide ABC transporter substrate-binding protein [Erythrobacter sp. WH131]|uniref:Peptide ABC transporter substrate-binding protein n=2 Tax=Erythrobacter ani TaxID=2827235 RepID=A0ABS6SL92_9SPHN|nr:ABC transporter substrate-binding protein [Erythrobacter ani]MBV7265805.1 peptide ABC transporter substrate-binding protein [Erythrobacter ani]